MDDEPLDIGAIQLADTHPTMMTVPLMPWLGEVPWMAGVLLFVCFMMTGAYIGIFYAPVWFPVWWLASKATAMDYHAFTTLALWLQTSFKDLRRSANGGSSVSPFPLRSRVPLGIYRDAV